MVIAGIDLAAPRAITAIGVAAASAAAWIALAAMHGSAEFARENLAALCLGTGAPPVAGLYPVVLSMWLLMAVAMMLPTAMPTIDLYVRLSRRMAAGRALRITLFVAGYVLAWSGFGVLAAAAQIGAGAVVLPLAAPGLAAGAVLALAGAYQLSPLKRACLDLCRNPMLYFMARWRESPAGTLGLGLGHGMICVGCCWALMALMFVAGTMNLVWMALLGLVMLAEKTLPAAPLWGRAGGVLMIGAGAVTIASGLI